MKKKEQTSFTIRNDSQREMLIVHEPECFEFNLPPNQEVQVETDAVLNSIVLNIAIDDNKSIISIIDSVSLYSVYYKGTNIFEKYL